MVSWITTTTKNTLTIHIIHLRGAYIWLALYPTFHVDILSTYESDWTRIFFTHGQDLMRFWEVPLTLGSRNYWFFMIRRAIGVYVSYQIIYHLICYAVISRIRAWRSHIAQEQQQEQHARIASNTQYLSFIILVFFCSISCICCWLCLHCLLRVYARTWRVGVKEPAAIAV